MKLSTKKFIGGFVIGIIVGIFLQAIFINTILLKRIERIETMQTSLNCYVFNDSQRAFEECLTDQ